MLSLLAKYVPIASHHMEFETSIFHPSSGFTNYGQRLQAVEYISQEGVSNSATSFSPKTPETPAPQLGRSRSQIGICPITLCLITKVVAGLLPLPDYWLLTPMGKFRCRCFHPDLLSLLALDQTARESPDISLFLLSQTQDVPVQLHRFRVDMAVGGHHTDIQDLFTSTTVLRTVVDEDDRECLVGLANENRWRRLVEVKLLQIEVGDEEGSEPLQQSYYI